MLQGWGEKGSKPWSFAQAIEDKIDEIKNPLVHDFVEEFYEEALEACVEAGYVVAGGIDAWISEQKQQQQTILGNDKIVEIVLNREAEDERVILAGKGEIIKEQILNTINNHNLIENRDVGMWVGEPIRQNLKKEKKEQTIISIRIFWRERQKPPWKDSKETSCEIPLVERSKVDWEKIKLAAGGTNGYLWGRFRATANLSNNGQAAIYAGSKDEAEDRLKALLTLSDTKILTLSVTEELKEGVRSSNRSLYKEFTRMYPAYFTIVNQQKVLNEENGRTSLSGTYKSKRDKISLWNSNKPVWFEEVINNLFREH